MTSFVALKEKRSKSESPVALQSSAEPSCSVYTLWASSPEAPAHLMWFPVPEQEQAMSTVSVRVWVKGNISVLTNMHNSACCQEKPQESHSLRKKKIKIPTLGCGFTPKQLSASLFRNNRSLIRPPTCMYCILNNSPGVDELPGVKKVFSRNLKWMGSFFLFYSMRGSGHRVDIKGTKVQWPPPPTCSPAKLSRIWLIPGERADWALMLLASHLVVQHHGAK